MIAPLPSAAAALAVVGSSSAGAAGGFWHAASTRDADTRKIHAFDMPVGGTQGGGEFKSRGRRPSFGPTGVKCARCRMVGFPAMTASALKIGLALLLGLASTAAIAQQATITRDDWGIAHVHGKTDADAVFGMAYAQAEDDFNRVETNYINAMGRLAEAEGEAAIWQDLRMKLFIDPAELQRLYGQSPD